jgi:ElaB/YqjD/DUF883 family membrane-anchored ribosome-binding protein
LNEEKEEKTKEELYDDFEEKKEQIETYVRKNPMTSLMGALGIGTAIGFLASFFKKN